MIYLATPSGERVRDAMRAGLIGCMTTPMQHNALPAGVPWAADNGAFGKGYPGDRAWLAWLDSRPWDRSLCLFATAPDVVGDAAATLARSLPFLPVIRSMGYPAALVAQNGLQSAGVPWELVDVLFLGGGLECSDHGQVEPRVINPRPPGARGGALVRQFCPTCGLELQEWKLSAAAAALTDEARRRGKPVHCGRVNGKARLAAAMAMGCASADGTFLAFGPDRNLPQLLRWLAEPMELPV